jgi:hypothetical protein
MEFNEYTYAELLKLLKQKEEQENTQYKQIELELPLIEMPTMNTDDEQKDNEDRGIIIIEF